MKKLMSLMFAGIILFGGTSVSVAKKWTFESFLKNLFNKTERYKTSIDQAAAVRGNKIVEEGAKTGGVFWAGAERSQRKIVSQEEMVRFEKVLIQTEEGKYTDALKDLNVFVKEYPESGLQDDAKQLLVFLEEKNQTATQ